VPTSQYKLFGYLPPIEGDIGFVTPIMALEKHFYIQVSENGQISKLVPTSDSFSNRIERIRATEISITEGEKTLFGYKFPAGDVAFGLREELQKKIGSRIEEIKADPFDLLNVSAFLDKKRIKEDALERSYAFWAREDRGIAAEWVELLEAKFNLKSTSKLYEINTITLYDFCSVLVRFAKVYDKYLKNRDTAFMNKYEYESLFHRLTTFIFDRDFVKLVEAEIAELRESPAQLSFDFPEPTEDRVRHLSRLGISRTKVTHFYHSIEENISVDSLNSISFDPILNLDKLMIDNADLSRSLCKVDKKIRKRELSTGLISIIYGTLLILSGMDIWYSHDRRKGDRMKIEGVKAISCGLQNLAPESVREVSLSQSKFH
jgi:hypothetical protein